MRLQRPPLKAMPPPSHHLKVMGPASHHLKTMIPPSRHLKAMHPGLQSTTVIRKKLPQLPESGLLTPFLLFYFFNHEPTKHVFFRLNTSSTVIGMFKDEVSVIVGIYALDKIICEINTFVNMACSVPPPHLTVKGISFILFCYCSDEYSFFPSFFPPVVGFALGITNTTIFGSVHGTYPMSGVDI